MKEGSIFENNNESDYEIRCPKCCFYISVELSNEPNNYNLIINCENCGQCEMSVNDFNFAMIENKNKICEFCCKLMETQKMMISSKNKFLCIECFQKLKNDKKIDETDFSLVKDLGKKCLKHNKKNLYFCLNCNKHFCEDCQESHSSHKIKKIEEEIKNKNEIDKLKQFCKDEKENLIKEKQFYYDIITNMKKRFKKIKENNENILELKKLLYDIYESNSYNYGVYKYTNVIINDKNYRITDDELNKIDKLIDDISLNNNNNNNNYKNGKNYNSLNKNNNNDKNKSQNSSKIKNILEQNQIDVKKYSKSVIKQTKKSIINLGVDNKVNHKHDAKRLEKNNKKEKNSHKYGGSVSTYKAQKNRKKPFVMSNREIINRPIYNIEDFKVEKNKNPILKSLPNSIICMLYLGNNKILVSVFSQKNDLILGEIKKEKNLNENELLTLDITSLPTNFKNVINNMELCEDDCILACSDDEIAKFKILNKKINVLFFHNLEKNFNIIISCISLSNELILILASPNIILFYEKGTEKYNLYNIGGYNASLMKKMTSNYLILVVEKDSPKFKTKVYLLVIEVIQNKLETKFERNLNVNEKEKDKIIIEKIFENYAVVTFPGTGFYIYDYIKDDLVFNASCHSIVNLKSEFINNENSVYCYIIETKYNEVNNIEEQTLKKYLIEKKKNFKNNSENWIHQCKNTINLRTKNQINEMIIISDNYENDMKLILLGDNDGNILFYNC